MNENIFTHLPTELAKINGNIAGVSQNVHQNLVAASDNFNHRMDIVERKINQALPP